MTADGRWPAGPGAGRSVLGPALGSGCPAPSSGPLPRPSEVSRAGGPGADTGHRRATRWPRCPQSNCQTPGGPAQRDVCHQGARSPGHSAHGDLLPTRWAPRSGPAEQPCGDTGTRSLSAEGPLGPTEPPTQTHDLRPPPGPLGGQTSPPGHLLGPQTGLPCGGLLRPRGCAATGLLVPSRLGVAVPPPHLMPLLRGGRGHLQLRAPHTVSCPQTSAGPWAPRTPAPRAPRAHTGHSRPDRAQPRRWPLLDPPSCCRRSPRLWVLHVLQCFAMGIEKKEGDTGRNTNVRPVSEAGAFEGAACPDAGRWQQGHALAAMAPDPR